MNTAKPLPFNSLTPKQVRNFWKHVDKSGDCWLWTASCTGKHKEQPQCSVNCRRLLAIRVGWFAVHGCDPYPAHVLHTCDNPKCCNPSHWFLGTNRDNCQDKSRKARNGRKLTAEKVQEIKRMLNLGYSQQEVADVYRVNQTLVSAISRGIVWTHVTT